MTKKTRNKALAAKKAGQQTHPAKKASPHLEGTLHNAISRLSLEAEDANAAKIEKEESLSSAAGHGTCPQVEGKESQCASVDKDHGTHPQHEGKESQFASVDKVRERLEDTMQEMRAFLNDHIASSYHGNVEESTIIDVADGSPIYDRAEADAPESVIREVLTERRLDDPAKGVTRLTMRTVDLLRIEEQIPLLMDSIVHLWMEPTGHLDPNTKEYVLAQFRKETMSLCYAHLTSLNVHAGFNTPVVNDIPTHKAMLAEYRKTLDAMVRSKPEYWKNVLQMQERSAEEVEEK